MKGTEAKETIRILLVGNSLSVGDQWPKLFEQLFNSSHDALQVEIHNIAIGASTLQTHWLEGTADIIRQQSWDYVVLFEHPMFGLPNIDGSGVTNSDALFRVYAPLFCQTIKDSGATPVLLLPYNAQGRPQDQNLLKAAHFDIAMQCDALLVPIGIAWPKAAAMWDTMLDTQDSLYSDLLHASPIGNVILAIGLYTFFASQHPGCNQQKAMHSLKALLSTRNEMAQYKIESFYTCFDICTESIHIFNSIGNDKTKSNQNSFLVKPSALPDGEAFEISELKGEWRGQLKLYADGVAEMYLHLKSTMEEVEWAKHGLVGVEAELKITQQNGATLHVPSLTLCFQGSSPEGSETLMQDLRFAEGQKGIGSGQNFMFTLELSGEIYRGVYRDGSIMGIVRHAYHDYPQVNRFGSWVLERV